MIMKVGTVGRIVGVGLGWLTLAGVAFADVTVERLVRSGGIKGIGASDSTTLEKLSGLKKREVQSTQLTGGFGKLLGRFAGDLGSDAITNVEQDRVWKLDHKTRTFSEASISAAMAELAEQQEKAGSEEQRTREKSDIRVVNSEISVRETGEKKNMNGFGCSQYIVTWLLETENTKTKERAKNTMTTELWNTPETKETAALAREEEEFTRAYVQKLGLDLSSREMKQLGFAVVAALFGGDDGTLEKGAKELREKMSKIKGFTIASAIRWDAGGGGELQAKTKEEAPSGGLGGMFGLAKKLVQGTAQSGEPQQPDTVLFDSYTEIKRIDLSPIPATEFEVPAGYKPAK
jgi:hypothetical protein